MPPSLLKYVDIARLVGAGIRCPVCGGRQLRQSRWHSKQEKSCSERLHPYRCDECTHRFLAARYAHLERPLVNFAAGLVLGIAVLAVGELWFDSMNEPAIRRVEAAAAVDSGGNTTATDAQQRALYRATGASEDTEALARKRQEAVENGDAGAMLELGRDLATGNKVPKDVEQAAKWVQLAAASGHPESMVELGRFYRDGVGLAQDSVRAYTWFGRAAAANHPTVVLERDALVRTMSEEKLKEAHKLALSEPAPAETVRRK